MTSPRIALPMLVTIVSAVTGSPLMRQGIESVQKQTYADIEHLIVIDGREREAQAKTILSEIDLSRHKTHIFCLPYATGKDGFICHRIYGMSPFLINGDYLCYLDEDNWYDPNHVESLVNLVTKNNLEWAYSLRKIVDKDGSFVCLDDCESLGKWPHLDNCHLVDTNCYFLKKSVALQFSSTWYARFREQISSVYYIDNPDKALCSILLERYPNVLTTGFYSVNYRLGGNESSVSLKFFYQHNQIKQQQYPKGFPWRQTKLKDIPLPFNLTKQADTSNYGEEFFHEVKAAAQKSAGAVLPFLWEILDNKITSVVDVGCGTASWLAQARSLFNVDDILGIDGNYINSGELEIPADKFQSHDLTTPLTIQRRFDLVICLEVAEHLPPDLADTFISSLTKLGDYILFSAAIPLQPGTNHINTQFPHYWVELFDRNGYKCLDCLREKFWHDDRVEWWYAQNMLLFVKEDLLANNDRLLSLYQKTDLDRLARIHPRNIASKAAFSHDDTIELITLAVEPEKDDRFKLHRELLFKVFAQSPYQHFPYLDYPCDLQGWGSQAPIFERLISQLQSKLIIEVGTWKGASALHMVDLLKSKNIVCPIICVDTWLGGTEYFLEKSILPSDMTIPRRYGYPELYFQFLANVMHKQAQDYIVPLPLHSTAAYKLIKSWQILADFIYIDGSHQEEDVYADLVHYWQLVRPKGVLLGDDYHNLNCPGVLVAVHRFAKENNLQIYTEGNKFWFKKPPSYQETIEALSKRIAELELKNNPDIDLSYFA